MGSSPVAQVWSWVGCLSPKRGEAGRNREGGNTMKSSIANRLAGELHEAKGKFKEKVGRMTNDPETESEGLSEKITGKIQKKIGQVQKALAKR
jgi:uncharacterized protein YjbJ (UPF0337 family)